MPPDQPRRKLLRAALSLPALQALPALSALGMSAPAPALAQSVQSAQAGSPSAPAVVRIGVPAVVAQPGVFWGAPGIVRYKNWFEEEFGDDVRIEYVGFKGGAPMVGQALANGQIDLAGQGDLLSIIGRSSGLKTRLVLPFTKLSNAYLAVGKKTGIRGVQDLRGKRVAYFKGNQIHLQVLRILALHGLKESDIRSISLDPASAGATLASGDIDAIFSSAELLRLRESGVADIVYSTRGQAQLSSYNGLIATEDFIARRPDLLTRLIKVFVRADQWVSEPGNRSEAIRIWSLGPIPNRFAQEDYADRPWSDRFSPLFDPLLVAHYERTQDQIAALGMLRGPRVDFGQWIDGRFAETALHQLGLQKYWSPLGKDGKIIRS